MGLFPFRIAKLGIKKPMKDKSFIGVKFWKVFRKVSPLGAFCGKFWKVFGKVLESFYFSTSSMVRVAMRR